MARGDEEVTRGWQREMLGEGLRIEYEKTVNNYMQIIMKKAKVWC